jgi:hypothetical protein
MRIEQFLFEQGIESTQAESLVSEFPNLEFNTNDDFYGFFQRNGIKLAYRKSNVSKGTTFPQKDQLLEQLKNFKSSTDYDYVKKYITEERKIQAIIDSGKVQNDVNILNSIKSQPLDPFFSFIVRKILTGSETGILPSEQLKQMMDELTKKTKKDIDTEPIATRDEYGRIVSFDNYLRNKGSIKVDLLDERFTISSFNYVVNNEFKSLPDAVVAEKNVLKKAAEFETLLNTETGNGGISTDEKTLTENLKKLIVENGNTIPALQAKVETLSGQINNLNETVDIKQENIDDLNRIIDELTDQRNLIVDENQIKDETISSLSEVIDSTLSDLESNVSKQLSNTADAFDALSTKIEAQAKKSEEASAKQLAAFEKAVGGIADSLKPKEPAPAPGNPASDIIKQIFTEWDKIYAIPNGRYSSMETILKNIDVKSPPPKLDYVFTPPASANSFGPGQEINQILKWNDTYKSQFKDLINGITDKTKATTVLTESKKLLSSDGGISEIKDIINTVYDEWSRDIGGSLGNGRPIIRKSILEMESTYTFTDDQSTKSKGQSLIKNTSDIQLILRVLRILSEISNVVDKGGSWLKIG